MSRGMMIALVASVLLATGAPLVNAYIMAEKFKNYPSFRVDIEPYDPRDLFYGHYLRFRIDWNWKEKPPEDQAQRFRRNHGNPKQCLCVGEGDVNPVVQVSECSSSDDALPDCRYTLKGTSYNPWSFENDVNRYYVSETLAKPLEALFLKQGQKFAIDLHVTPDGKSLPGQLYIEGMPLKEFLARNGGKVPGVDTEETR